MIELVIYLLLAPENIYCSSQGLCINMSYTGRVIQYSLGMYFQNYHEEWTALWFQLVDILTRLNGCSDSVSVIDVESKISILNSISNSVSTISNVLGKDMNPFSFRYGLNSKADFSL